MNVLSAIFNFIQKPIAHVADEYRRRTLVLGMIAVLASLYTAINDSLNHLVLSTTLDLLLAGSFSVLVFIDFKETNFNVKIGYLLVFNLFVTLLAFAEGIYSGAFLFFFVGIVSMAFMLDKDGKSDPYISYYITFIAICFFGTIIYAPLKSSYENIPESLVREMFINNCVTVVVLISIFTYVGVRMEKNISAALMQQKRKAEAHEEKISLQNIHLREIAFMSAHSVRSPLTNIMSIAQLINVDAITTERDKILIKHLRSSSLELDKVIHDIVAKTATAENQANNDFTI